MGLSHRTKSNPKADKGPVNQQGSGDVEILEVSFTSTIIVAFCIVAAGAGMAVFYFKTAYPECMKDFFAPSSASSNLRRILKGATTEGAMDQSS